MSFIPTPCTPSGPDTPPCVSESISTAGLCLGDGTPIAVVAQGTAHDCGAAATPPTVVGWINLLTGSFTAGNPPAGSRACSGNLDFELSGILCDIQPDGTNAQTVTIEYEYDDETGALIGTRIVSVTTGATYVPTGILQPCGGTDDFEYEILCDSNGQFIRQYRTNAAGVIAVADFTLGGIPYVASGTVNLCTGSLSFEAEVLCDDNGPFIRRYTTSSDGTPSGTVDFELDGVTPYVTSGPVVVCQGAIFAGFVCDAFAGTPVVPATPPTCPGSPLTTASPDTIGSGYTEGPAGTFIQTSNLNTSLTFDAIPSDAQHGICAIHFELNAANGNNGFAAYGWQGLDVNGNSIGSGPGFISDIETAIGVGSDNPMPSGSTASAVVGGTTITFTNTGPSQNLMTSTNTGNFLTREGDGDGQASGVTLEFDPPLRSFTITSNTGFDGTTGVENLQRANATPGTAAIPAQPPTNVAVKQFRNADGTSFYENLDGTVHTVAGTIGDCGENLQVVLCDATGTQFLRVYNVSGGVIVSHGDYDFEGDLFAPVLPAHVCAETLATFRHTPIEVLCWTETANPANVVQFLRRYLIDQDGVTVVAVVDSLLNGTTPFVASNLGTVAICDSSATATFLDFEEQILCDATPTRFIRTYVYDSSAPSVVQSFFDTDLSGAPFVPVGAVSQCPISVTTVAGIDSELQFMCDSNGPTTFIRRYEWNNVTGAFVATGDFTLTGGAYVPVGTVTPGQCTAAAGATVDTEELILCDDNGGFIRRQLFNGVTGAFISSTDLTLAGAPYVAVGTVRSCADPSFEVQEEVLCDDNGGFIRRFVFNGLTGALLSTTNLTLAGGAYAPVGTVGFCGRDSELQTMCDNGVTTFLRRFIFNGATGAVIGSNDFTIAGAPYVPVGPVTPGNCVLSTIKTLNSQMFSATPGTPWTPALVLGTLTSVTMTVITGTATVTDFNGTVTALIPAGYTANWQATDQDILVPPTSIASVGGSVLVIWTER